MFDDIVSAVTGRSKGRDNGTATVTPILVDTSAIIDGRIEGVARTGFIPGMLLVPRFVLHELQHIADSSDPMRRGRGRRGLEMLNSIRESGIAELQVIDDDVEGVKEVDAKLVRLARNLGAKVLTTDYNLNRVASVEGVRVLNVNELSNAIRPVVLPGEHMQVQVVQPGKERGQGVGYLPDGTMIVVDGGDKLLGRDVAIEITRVLQTVAGKMLFAVPVGQPDRTKPLSMQQDKVAAVAATDFTKLPDRDPKTNQPSGVPAGRRNNNRRPRPTQARQQPTQPVTATEIPSEPVNGSPVTSSQRKTAPAARSPRSQKAHSNTEAPKRRKRQSPTQKLEDSLINMTSGE